MIPRYIALMAEELVNAGIDDEDAVRIAYQIVDKLEVGDYEIVSLFA